MIQANSWENFAEFHTVDLKCFELRCDRWSRRIDGLRLLLWSGQDWLGGQRSCYLEGNSVNGTTFTDITTSP